MTAPASDSANEQSSDPSSKHEAGGTARKGPRRLLPRFGLRSLFVFALLFCLFFGWIGRNAYRMRQEDAAIETLVQAGAAINMQNEPDHGKLLGDMPGQPPPAPPSSFARLMGWSDRSPIRAVRLDDYWLDDSQLAAAFYALGQLPEIERVILLGDRCDDRAIPALAKLPRLEELYLDETGITGEGLASLAPHVRLRRIEVSAYGPGILRGVSAFAELQDAKLIGMDVTRDEVAGLASLSHLERLELRSVGPTRDEPGTDASQSREEVYAPLAQAKGLKTFYAADIGMTDVEAAALAGLSLLEELFLDGISDAGLARLGAQPNLKVLRTGPPVTRQAARMFSAAHPACLVYYWVDEDPFAYVGVVPEAERSQYFRAGEPTDERIDW